MSHPLHCIMASGVKPGTSKMADALLYFEYSELVLSAYGIFIQNFFINAGILSLCFFQMSQLGMHIIAMHFGGEEPLTVSRLASAAPEEQKQILGECLLPLIQRTHYDLAGKITGMLLEMDNEDVIHLLEKEESLQAKVQIKIISGGWFLGVRK